MLRALQHRRFAIAGRAGGGAAPIPWYLSGGISAENCIAAYQPKGAASFAASKINIANPGTHDLTDGVAQVTFDTAVGWTSTNANTYLVTDISPDSNTSLIVRYSQTTGFLFGSYRAGQSTNFWLNPAYAGNVWAQLGTREIYQPPSCASGIICISSDSKIYYNGSLYASFGTSNWSGSSYPIFFPGYNNDGAINGVNALQTIVCLAIYNISLAPYIAALTAAMGGI